MHCRPPETFPHASPALIDRFYAGHATFLSHIPFLLLQQQVQILNINPSGPILDIFYKEVLRMWRQKDQECKVIPCYAEIQKPG